MHDWADRNVFVTGATGLLGSALVARLVEQGATVTCLVRDRVPQAALWQSPTARAVRVVYGSLEDAELVVRALNEHEIDSVFHLGAQTIVGTAARSALSTFETNVRGTWNVLEACHRLQPMVKRVVIASSDKAYGQVDQVPYTEEQPLCGSYPYDASKACAEIVARSYFATYQLPLAIARCGNLYGPGDLNFNRLVPGVVRDVLRGREPVVRSDGSYLRDYLYVDDAVSAYLRLAERLTEPQVVGEAFNFGNEQPVSVIDVVRLIVELAGVPELSPRILNEACHEIRTQYLDCTKAHQALGWQPRVALREGLTRTIQWYRRFLQNGSPKS